MFDQTFVNTHANTRKSWTVAVSMTAQTVVVGTLLLVPLLHPEILYPKLDPPKFIHLQPIQPVTQVAATHDVPVRHTVAPKAFVAPRAIPDRVTRIVDKDLGTAPETFAIAGAIQGFGQEGADAFSNLIQGSLPGTPPSVKHDPPTAKLVPAVTGPLQVSSGVQDAKLIFKPTPTYPPLARAARVQGTVRIQAVIAADGSIGNLKVMSGPPLLIKAAIEAVAQWRYRPTLLNGKAVQVITEIDVIFSLNQ
jgi:protein TonB